VTPLERVAIAIAQLHGLKTRRLLCTTAFKGAVLDALEVMTEDELLKEVSEQGGLKGARCPYAVLISRIQKLPSEFDTEGRLKLDLAEARRLRQIDGAVERARDLSDVVARGTLVHEEAARMLAAEFADDLLALAMAVLEGGAS
jgi:hypothetical protein